MSNAGNVPNVSLVEYVIVVEAYTSSGREREGERERERERERDIERQRQRQRELML